jgi:hypothetical protein
MAASTKYNTTLSDKSTFVAAIVDTEKYGKLSETEQAIFKLLRNSLIEIFPIDVTTGNPDNEVCRFAENYAFINLGALTSYISTITEQKISELRTELKAYITESLKSYSSSSTTTTSTS